MGMVCWPSEGNLKLCKITGNDRIITTGYIASVGFSLEIIRLAILLGYPDRNSSQ